MGNGPASNGKAIGLACAGLPLMVLGGGRRRLRHIKGNRGPFYSGVPDTLRRCVCRARGMAVAGDNTPGVRFCGSNPGADGDVHRHAGRLDDSLQRH